MLMPQLAMQPSEVPAVHPAQAAAVTPPAFDAARILLTKPGFTP